MTTELGLVYPNPASSRATMPYSLAEASQVRMTVYDALGREVMVLVDGPVEAGRHEVDVDLDDLPTGVYAVRFRAGETVQTRTFNVAR